MKRKQEVYYENCDCIETEQQAEALFQHYKEGVKLGLMLAAEAALK